MTPEGRDEPAAATSSREQATGGVPSPAVMDITRNDRQGSLDEVALPEAGPLSPTSPFAAADTGHLTVIGDEGEAPQLKGAAAAVAHARRKSLGEELPEISGAQSLNALRRSFLGV